MMPIHRKDSEYFDVLSCAGEKTGEVIERNEAHRSGAWHGSFHCLILYEREGRGYALFQKRSAAKIIAPGKFDVSVGGHYSAGEDAIIAGPREIREELGLNVGFNELLNIGRRVFVYCFTDGVKEYEFQDVFLLPRLVRPEDITLQTEEVDGLLEMEVESGIRLFSGRNPALDCAFLKSDKTMTRSMVSSIAFVPCLDNYYLKLLLLCRRYFKGEQDQLFI